MVSSKAETKGSSGLKIVTTGAWFLDQGLRPLPSKLVEFCETSCPPIYIGFGSMIQRDPLEAVAQINEALDMTETKAVISLGWSGLDKGAFSRDCFVVSSTAHKYLFKRVVAAIHHGGAGTTAAALSAGLPQGIIPHMRDQFYWAEHIAKLGVGIALPDRTALESRTLAEMIGQLTTDKALASNARRLAARIDRGRGVAIAADILEGGSW